MATSVLINEFKEAIANDDMSYDDVILFASEGDNEVTEALWEAWSKINMDIFPYTSDEEFNFQAMTQIPKDEFLERCRHGGYGSSGIPFYDELANRVQLYYTKKVDMILHGGCVFALKKGENKTKCDCGKDISERVNQLQNVLKRF